MAAQRIAGRRRRRRHRPVGRAPRRADGWTVRVHRNDRPGASWVAGGMLAPHSEGWPGEERLLRLGLASLAAMASGRAGSYAGRPAARCVTAASRWWSPSTAPTSPT